MSAVSMKGDSFAISAASSQATRGIVLEPGEFDWDRQLGRCDDALLRQIVAKCGDILSERDRSRKEEALRKANELLKGAGLNPREFVEVKKQKRVGRSTGGREKK